MIKIFSSYAFAIAFLITPLEAKKGEFEKETSQEIAALPWLTGPLLASSGLVIPGGHINLEPYFFATFETAIYDSDWHAQSTSTLTELNWQFYIEVGLTSWMDFQVVPAFSYDLCKGSHTWVFNDLKFLLDFQLLTENPVPSASWIPSIKLTIGELFPTGKYQHLNQNKNFTDEGGGGSFQTLTGITFSKLIHIYRHHFLNLRFNFSYTIPAPVHVHGLNSYGGGTGTDATVYPGNTFGIDFAGEYTLTQNWAFACDLVGNWSARDRHSGTLGTTSTGAPANLGTGASTEFSIAPAIEYNWSSQLGLIGGIWWSVAGRNSAQFYSGVIALNYYY